MPPPALTNKTSESGSTPIYTFGTDTTMSDPPFTFEIIEMDWDETDEILNDPETMALLEEAEVDERQGRMIDGSTFRRKRT